MALVAEETTTERFNRIREEEIEPLKREAGWPDDEDEPVSPDEINRYIELLEAKVVGQRAAMSTIGRGMFR